jgi:BirA family transcriptional regulator, biotin operon repressor / biotin---[acetyl-CoA-carboxylase] ligase
VNFVGKKIIEFQHLDSTNDYCRQIADIEKLEEGTVVWARHQSNGRGQGKNSWESQKGRNLTFSVILKPEFLEAADMFLLSMVISLGITGYLREHTGEVSIKWPNDIYAGSKKIAGILIESSVMGNRVLYSIAGIGININQTRFPGHLPNAVSLKQLTLRSYPLKDSLISICSNIGSWYRLLEGGESGKVRDTYTGQLYRLNESHLYVENNNRFSAVIRGVDKFGRLLLEDGQGSLRPFGMKEIEYSD